MMVGTQYRGVRITLAQPGPERLLEGSWWSTGAAYVRRRDYTYGRNRLDPPTFGAGDVMRPWNETLDYIDSLEPDEPRPARVLCRECGTYELLESWDCFLNRLEPTSFRSRLEQSGRCLSCDLWCTRIETMPTDFDFDIAPDPKQKCGRPIVGALVAERAFYTVCKDSARPGEGDGFGGRRVKVVLASGREVVTRNLWHGGEIPNRWRPQLPDTARLEWG